MKFWRKPTAAGSTSTYANATPIAEQDGDHRHQRQGDAAVPRAERGQHERVGLEQDDRQREQHCEVAGHGERLCERLREAERHRLAPGRLPWRGAERGRVGRGRGGQRRAVGGAQPGVRARQPAERRRVGGQRAPLGGVEPRLRAAGPVASRAACAVASVSGRLRMSSSACVLPQRHAERHDERRDADDQAHAELAEVLDERELLIVRDARRGDRHRATGGPGRPRLVGRVGLAHRGAVGRGRDQLVPLVVTAADRALELADAAADGAPDLGELLGPDDEQGDDEDDDQFHGSDVRHLEPPVRERVVWTGRVSR